MYKTVYAEEAGASAKMLRDGERAIMQQSIDLLQAAECPGAEPLAATTAIVFTRRLWMMLMEDLGRDANSLPEQTRASLISIGLWVLRECDEIRLGRSKNFSGLIDVSKSIRDGLK